MNPIRLLSAAEQVAGQLRGDILEGRLSGEMPGIYRLAAGLGVNHKTVNSALELLEREGLLISRGPSKSRRIAAPGNHVPATMRIAILLYEPDDRKIDYLLDLQSQLQESGHDAFFASKTLTELGMDVKRIAKLVAGTKADAWVVVGGSSPVLQWFAAQPRPVFGLFGRTVRLPIAATCPVKTPVLQAVIRRLTSFGHSRIVMFVREERRKPIPGFLEQAFLNELHAQGIPTGPYNLPDWEETRAGFHRSLDSLFLTTPPTALLIQGTALTVATLQHLADYGIKAPRDVSLICMDPDPAFAWCDPVISHITYDSRPWLRHIVRWANNIARGKDDRSKTAYRAKFIEGGTIGSAKGE